MKIFCSASGSSEHVTVNELVERDFQGYCEVRDGKVVRSEGKFDTPHLRIRYNTDPNSSAINHAEAHKAADSIVEDVVDTPFDTSDSAYNALLKDVEEQVVPDFSKASAHAAEPEVVRTVDDMGLEDGYYSLKGTAYIDYLWYFNANWLAGNMYYVRVEAEGEARPEVAEAFMTNKAVASSGTDPQKAVTAGYQTHYYIDDTYEAPQAGSDRVEFDEWWELEEYLDDNPDVRERIEDGYATIGEI